MGSFAQLLTQLHAIHPNDNLARGLAFERVCKWYLQTAPEYRNELRHVWLWREWPDRWSNKEAGIDLVAETMDGDLWAIQAKCYDPDHRITKRNIDSFLSESARSMFSYRLLLTTARELGPMALRTVNALGIGYGLLADLDRAEVNWPDSPDDLSAAPLTAKNPRPHQTEAIDAVCNGFEQEPRGQLLMACGTGKTLTALWIAERLKCGRILVLLPSLSLLAQTLRVWNGESTRPFRSLAVCSDETVAKGQDSFVANTNQLGVPVTTDTERIARFLAGDDTRVVFSTYHSLPKLAEAFGDGNAALPPFDLVVADEAHRCAGPSASTFATVLDAELLPGARRLFMTATPRLFTGRTRRVAGQADWELVSMDDPAKFGPVFHRMSFGEAIERGLLADYQVVIIGVTNETFRSYAQSGANVTRDGRTVEDARTLSSHVALAKAMKRYDLHRVISFHNRIKRAGTFSQDFPEVVEWMPQDERPEGIMWARHVSGKMPSGHRDATLDRFRSLRPGERGLLSNARCLSEGIDVPSIDGIAFVEPRSSQVDIVQAVGRAIRLTEDKKIGTIVLSVFIGDDDDPVEAIETSAFKHIWQVLRALRDHDEGLAEELDGIRRQSGLRQAQPASLPTKLVLDFPVDQVGQEFVRAFETRLVEQSTSTWEFWFGLLLALVDREGHALVHAHHHENGFPLGAWVSSQRAQYAQQILRSSRVLRLERVEGWAWDAFAERWEEGYRALLEYVATEGHALVPQQHRVDNLQLGSWVGVQRRAHKKGQLDAEYVERLESVTGWSWEPHVDKWEAGYHALAEFAQREGHALVPLAHVEEEHRLGSWVGVQRKAHANGTLSSARVSRLQDVRGWCWDPAAERFQEMCQALLAFVEREGHALVPNKHVEGSLRLGSWVCDQRKSYGKKELGSDRVSQLQSIRGWSWDPGAGQWDAAFQSLVCFVEREGHALVPQAHCEGDFRLGAWVGNQRLRYRKGKLVANRVARLEALRGWAWDRIAERWEKGFRSLVRFVEREAHALVPKLHVESGFLLGRWTTRQRLYYTEGELESNRAARLEALPGWSWDPQADRWDRSYAALTEYVGREGHSQVPYAHLEQDFRLGIWVARQRAKHASGKLSAKQIERLACLPSWVWREKGAGPSGKRRSR